MSPARLRLVGVTIGLALAGATMVLFVPRLTPRGSAGPILSDCDGALRTIVVHYTPDGSFALPAYRDFVRQLPADVEVLVACPDRAALDELAGALGEVPCRLTPAVTGHEMTVWSRDRWLAMGIGSDGRTLLVPPRQEAGSGVWPQRAGDERIAADLAATLPDRIASYRSHLAFDGGDFVCDGETAFVTPAVARRNIQHTVESRDELVRDLEHLLRKRVVLLEEAPDHHAGMFMMAAGGRTVLVGDPSLATRHPHPNLPDGVDDTPDTRRKFDAVADRAAAEGYRVLRIPLLPSRNGRVFVTYLNAILDQRDGQRIVYMPVYRGYDALNDAGEAVWRSVGYDVRRVDCTDVFVHFGSLRCLVNVVRRG